MVNLLTLNVSASLNVFRLIANPSLCLPHHTVPTFNHLPIPLSDAFIKDKDKKSRVDIRAVVLDKDNCFAVPKQNEVYKPYSVGVSMLHHARERSLGLLVQSLMHPRLRFYLATSMLADYRCTGTIRRAQTCLSRITLVDSIKFSWYIVGSDWRRSRST